MFNLDLKNKYSSKLCLILMLLCLNIKSSDASTTPDQCALYLNPTLKTMTAEASGIYNQNPIPRNAKFRTQKKSRSDLQEAFFGTSPVWGRQRTSLDYIMIQTTLITNRPFSEVEGYFKSFPKQGFNDKDIEINLLIQTAFLAQFYNSNFDIKNVIDFFLNHLFRQDLIDKKIPKIALAVMIQTAYISNSSIEEVFNHFKNFQNTFYSIKSLSHSLVIQTAFLSQIDPAVVLHHFKWYPNSVSYFNLNTVAIMAQTGLYIDPRIK